MNKMVSGMITERQKTILNAVIREYVATAEPVASEHVVEKYRLPYSPATVRNELISLEEAGLLAQPHTSAGRVPTDKGYRFFISHATGTETPREMPGREEQAIMEIREADDPAEFIRQSSRVLAHLTRNLVLAGFAEEQFFYKSGFGEVMLAPEFSEAELMHEFTALADVIDEELWRMLGMFDARSGQPQVFIGRENPIPDARRYGMIVSIGPTHFDKESMIVMIGPKRMDYERNVAILKQFQEILNR